MSSSDLRTIAACRAALAAPAVRMVGGGLYQGVADAATLKGRAVLSEDLVSLLPRCVANVRGRSIGPTRNEILRLATRASLSQPEDLGKEMLMRSLMREAVDGEPGPGERFVVSFVAAVRACGGFVSNDENYVGEDLVRRLQQAFEREGWHLEQDGALQPRVLDGLGGHELSEALRVYVRRAQRGVGDNELVIGTSKCLEEAVARHVLTEATGAYESTMDFVSTLYAVFDRLGLAAPKSTDLLDPDPYRELQIAIYLVARAVNRLRNDRGDGHGRPTASVATALEARLSAGGAALVSELLLTALGA